MKRFLNDFLFFYLFFSRLSVSDNHHFTFELRKEVAKKSFMFSAINEDEFKVILMNKVFIEIYFHVRKLLLVNELSLHN